MKNNKGFTLLELLVAATIIGILAVFATTAYKNSAADARVEAAKTRTAALANAVTRMRIEYPAFKNVSGRLSNVPTSAACSSDQASGLVACGFLENQGWSDDKYMSYYVCDIAKNGCSSSSLSNPLACMVSTNDAKLPERYHNYMYCVSATGHAEN